MTSQCRRYFRDITGKGESKLDKLFDGYYFCVLVGFGQAKINTTTELEATAFVDEYPVIYQKNACDYLAALLIGTEAKRIRIDTSNADALEKLMARLLDSHSKTRLSPEGENLLNQYAARGIDIISEKMLPHTSLEEFYQDYFECFEKGAFFE